jgi:hypothetical protein
MANDICENRHQGNAESIDANNRNSFTRELDRHRVLTIITEKPSTMAEVAAKMQVQLNTISGRGSELKKLGLVAPTGERRNGGAVLRAL